MTVDSGAYQLTRSKRIVINIAGQNFMYAHIFSGQRDDRPGSGAGQGYHEPGNTGTAREFLICIGRGTLNPSGIEMQ